MAKPLFTIGHSLRAPWEFLELLRVHDVSAVCDVRSIPVSRRNPPFTKEVLRRGLRSRRIAYVHMPELGARSTDPTVYRNGRVQYWLLAETPSFQEGLERVRRGLEDHTIALMCAERDPITCHRAILVTRKLRQSGLAIAHIIDSTNVESNEDLERRLLHTSGLGNEDFFTAKEELVERAYDLQGDRIAYSVYERSGPVDRQKDGATSRSRHERD
jgi:uncharacterized protein (DUF488 family)